MKTKLKKFATPRENVHLLIQPRRRKSDEEVVVTGEANASSGDSPSAQSSPSITSVPSKSSVVEIPCAIRKESKICNDLSDAFRALLKVNDNCYEVDISHDNRTPAKDDQNTNCLKKPNSQKKRKRNGASICLMGTRYSIISRIAKSLGWKVVRDTDLWNICWTDSVQGVDMYKDMKRFQKVNHFPGMVEICRKDLLARNLIRMQRLFPVDYNFFPKTWCFPADLGDAISYSRQFKNKTFIIKPDTGAQGRGIWITKNLKEIKPNERMICQVYIDKPLLIDGYKFDLRVYTLVTSVDPLRIFVYNEGLARFATSKYKEPSGYNTSNVYMHLTNYSVNKHSQTFSKDDEDGSKRKFSTLNRILSSEGFDVGKLWHGIDEIIVKTVLTAWPVLKHHYHACFPCHDVVQACFEILGFDILVDGKMKPLLLEVNHSPSFHTDEVIDKQVKEALIRDTFQILNIALVDKRKILKEDKKRVQSRLLQKIRESSKNVPTISNNEPVISEGVPRNVVLSPNIQQIAWEESHLGNFRRVMPAPDNPNKYAAFLILQNQASIYSETAASKRREEAAKQLRYEIIQRTLKDQRNQSAATKKQNVDSVEGKMEQKLKKAMMKSKASFSKSTINEFEERERVTLLSQRDFLIRSSGLVQQIFENFYQSDLLSESDRKKFSELYDKLESEALNNSLLYPEQCQVHNRLVISNGPAIDHYEPPQSTTTYRFHNHANGGFTETADELSKYISSMSIADPSVVLKRLRRVRGKYTELYRKPKAKDRG